MKDSCQKAKRLDFRNVNDCSQRFFLRS